MFTLKLILRIFTLNSNVINKQTKETVTFTIYKRHEMFRFVFLFVIYFSCENIDSIELKYKYSIGDQLTYFQTEIVERHDRNRGVEETIEFIQMNFTDFIQEEEEENSMKIIRRQMNSLKIIPKNDLKFKELSKINSHRIDEESLSKPIVLSSYNGNVLLLPRNEIYFPRNQIEINETWIHPIANSLGQIQYQFKSIEQNRFAHIEYEGTLEMSAFADLIGNVTFDIDKGILIYEQIISSSSLLLDFTFTKTIIKRFLF